MTPPNPSRTPIFYGLPKIHKPNIPLRPIVSGFDSPTDNLSRYITHFLQPLAERIPAFIKDTTHFINTIHATERIAAVAKHLDKWRKELANYAPNT